MVGQIPRANYAGVLDVGGVSIQCYVLENEMRIVSQLGIQKSIGMSSGRGKGDHAHRLALFAGQIDGKGAPFKDLAMRISNPTIFKRPNGGRPTYGYEATILADICDAILGARGLGELLERQMHLASRAELLVRAFARVGIIALVDEVTGYQKDRKADELAQILKSYVNPTLRPWMKTFPDEYYQQIFRLQDWPVDQWSSNRPGYVGHITNKIVYERLPEGVLGELKKKNPSEHGRRRWRHFQFLTVDVGNQHLREHLILVIALMKAAEDWDQFIVFFTRNFGIPGDQIRFDLAYRSDAAFSQLPPEKDKEDDDK